MLLQAEFTSNMFYQSSLIALFVSDPHCHQPVPVPERESHTPGQTDAACGETLPWGHRTQRSVPGPGQLHL